LAAHQKKLRGSPVGRGMRDKALHSKLLTKLLRRFSSWNEFFAISEVRVLLIFSKLPKFPNIRKTLFPNFFPNFFRTFWPNNRVFWLKNSNFTYFFQNFQNLRTFLNNIRNFSRKFFEFENSVFFWKISELRQPNISETCVNEKFGKFRITQGLNERHCPRSCQSSKKNANNLFLLYIRG